MTIGADAWVVDTDIQIHRLSIDRGLRSAAEKKRTERQPVAATAYSRLEFKGNYISCLRLLRTKVEDSEDVESVFARVQKADDRRCKLMIRHLVKALGGVTFLQGDWLTVQGTLLTYIDGEITAAWRWFTDSVDHYVDDLACSRAAEPPVLVGRRWDTTIPECRASNTRCRVVELVRQHEAPLRALAEGLSKIPAGELTRELNKIAAVLRQTFAAGRFPWEGETCRSVGDLLIALHAVSRRGLVTSNKAEHDTLAPLLGYAIDLLSVPDSRLK